jgi:DUF1009 family protein
MDQSSMTQSSMSQFRGERYALIAGNGRFPFLVLEAARAGGRRMLVAAIREEADPALERRADGRVALPQSGLGLDLWKLRDLGLGQHAGNGQCGKHDARHL